jgi:DNA-directed RNA polymerase subunit M/transcription elongation factor TFIIS
MNTNMTCNNCGSIILADDINVQQLIAKCGVCGNVFPFNQAELIQTETSFNADKKTSLKAKKSIPLPKGISMEQKLNELNFTISWRKTRRLGLYLVITLIWNAILLPFLFSALQQNSTKMVLILSLHFIVGISMVLFTIAILINTTTVVVSYQGINIKIGPIPVPFNPSISLSNRDIKQLYVEEYAPSSTNGKPDLTYAVRAKLESGEELRLISGFSHPDYALFLEQEIETFLHIPNEE